MAEPPSKRPRRGYEDNHSNAPPRSRDDRGGRRENNARDARSRRSRSPAPPRRDRPSGRRDRSTSRDRGNRRRGIYSDYNPGYAPYNRQNQDAHHYRSDDTRARSPPRGGDRDRDSRRRSPPAAPRGAPSGPRNGTHVPSNRRSQYASQDADAVNMEVRAEDAMDVDGTEENAEEAMMRRMMGFSKFKTTKNSKVPGNDKNYGVRKEKKVEYRQYMNRVGGFNRPLSPSRG